jgi:hypothetical protein
LNWEHNQHPDIVETAKRTSETVGKTLEIAGKTLEIEEKMWETLNIKGGRWIASKTEEIEKKMYGIEERINATDERTDEIAGEKGITLRARTHSPGRMWITRLDFDWFTGHNFKDQDTMDTVDISMADTTIDTAEDEQKIEKMWNNCEQLHGRFRLCNRMVIIW